MNEETEGVVLAYKIGSSGESDMPHWSMPSGIRKNPFSPHLLDQEFWHIQKKFPSLSLSYPKITTAWFNIVLVQSSFPYIPELKLKENYFMYFYIAAF